MLYYNPRHSTFYDERTKHKTEWGNEELCIRNSILINFIFFSIITTKTTTEYKLCLKRFLLKLFYDSRLKGKTIFLCFSREYKY